MSGVVQGWATDTVSQFEVSRSTIQKATDHFVTQLRHGLRQDGTDLLQVPSYVVKLPTGDERGICLAVDLGGTNLRVCSVELLGQSKQNVVQSKVVIPPEVMTATSYRDLFGFIARHTESFLLQHLPEDVRQWREMVGSGTIITDEIRAQKRHALGFTFSFTFDQHAIDKGTLLYWTKAMDVKDAIGRDPCAMLQEAFDDVQLPLVVKALVNDTVGALAARAYASPGARSTGTTLLAAIFGTGTNGAYMERLSNITKLHHSRPEFSSPSPDDFMALNTEWGGFDNALAVLPTTQFDLDLDRDSANPDDQHYEKRISGLYLGELLRRIILTDLQSTSPVLGFKASSASRLHTAYSIDSSFLSDLISDGSPDLHRARELLRQVLDNTTTTTTTTTTTHVSVDDAAAVRRIAEAIGRRSARLSAIAIAAIVIQSGRLEGMSAVSSSRTATNTTTTSKPQPSHIPRSGFLGRLFSRLQSLFCGPRTTSVDHSAASQDKPVDSDSTSEELDVDSRKEDEVIDIGVDGSLFEFLPDFEKNLRGALREILQIGARGEKRIQFGIVKDGSGIGAALVACSC